MEILETPDAPEAPAPAPESILRELSELWISLGGQSQTENGAGVLRACSMTLMVLAESSDDASALGETIAALMPEHPARTIMVWLVGQRGRRFSARVQSQCWMPFGERRQICCEQIEITAPDTALHDLKPFVLPLAAPDLPLIIWSRSARLAALPEFREISAMGSKTIVDSAQFPDAAEALSRIADAVVRGRTIGDLAWTRLTRWRELLARTFEHRANLERLPGIADVRIAFGAGQETSARYLGAWLMAAIESAGARPRLSIAPGETLSASLTGSGIAVELVAHAGRLAVALDGVSDCAALPEPGDYPLVREELAIVRRDALFERALASAARLAYPTET